MPHQSHRALLLPNCFSTATHSFLRGVSCGWGSAYRFWLPLATLSVYRKVEPHSDSTSSGVGGGGFFCRPGGSIPGRQLVPTLQSVWTDFQITTQAFFHSFPCILFAVSDLFCFFVPQHCSFPLFFTIPFSSLNSLWRTLFSSCLLTVVVLCEKHCAWFGCLKFPCWLKN